MSGDAKSLAKAKKELPHGEFLPACAELGLTKNDPARLIAWYEACENPGIREFDPAAAEQKMSRHAREEFCRAEPGPVTRWFVRLILPE